MLQRRRCAQIIGPLMVLQAGKSARMNVLLTQSATSTVGTPVAGRAAAATIASCTGRARLAVNLFART